MATKKGKVGKQKNHRSAKKTFAKTGRGLLKMEKACKRHLLLQKSKRQKKAAGKAKLLAKGDSATIRAMAPSL